MMTAPLPPLPPAWPPLRLLAAGPPGRPVRLPSSVEGGAPGAEPGAAESFYRGEPLGFSGWLARCGALVRAGNAVGPLDGRAGLDPGGSNVMCFRRRVGSSGRDSVSVAAVHQQATPKFEQV